MLGFADDAAVLAGAIKLVAGHIRPEHRDAARAKLEDRIRSRPQDDLPHHLTRRDAP